MSVFFAAYQVPDALTYQHGHLIFVEHTDIFAYWLFLSISNLCWIYHSFSPIKYRYKNEQIGLRWYKYVVNTNSLSSSSLVLFCNLVTGTGNVLREGFRKANNELYMTLPPTSCVILVFNFWSGPPAPR